MVDCMCVWFCSVLERETLNPVTQHIPGLFYEYLSMRKSGSDVINDVFPEVTVGHVVHFFEN